MTESLFKSPGTMIKELQAQIAVQKMEPEGREAELKRKEAEIKRLQRFC